MRYLYEISKDRNETAYSFTTDSNVQYIATFLCVDSLGVDNLFMFNIDRIGDKRSPKDHKIKQTIVHILEAFFEDNQNSMIYVCDSSDARGCSRHRLFRMWYVEANPANIERYDINLPTPDYELFSSLFVHSLNQAKEAVIAAFYELTEATNDYE